MAHYSVRAPNSTASQQQRVDDNWTASQHRSYAGAPGPGPGAGAGPGSARLMETLEALRAEFEGIVHDNSILKNQREDFEAKAASQIGELNQIKAAVQELENFHQKSRQRYEEELARLREENHALRAAASAQPPPLPGPGPSSALGVSGVSLPPANAFSSQHPSAIERSTSGRPSDPYDRGRDRDDDLPPPKRPKVQKEDRSPEGLTDQPELMPRGSPPPLNNEFPGDIDPSNIPADLRKEGPDWFAMYNPRVQKTLDVNLLHQFNHNSVVCCVRFSKDGKLLATGCNRTAQIFDMKTGSMTCQLNDTAAQQDGDLYIRSVCFSPDGKYLATGAEDRQIRIWDLAKRTIKRHFEGHEQEIYSLDFSQDGRLIVSGSGDRTARIWDMETGEHKILSIMDSDSNDAAVTSVAISPNGRFVAAGSLDSVVRLWDVATGNLLECLRGHRDSVYSVAFTPDGKGLISGSLDKTLKYWELNLAPRGANDKYAKSLFNFIGHKDYVLSVAISDDGQWIVSGSKDRSVQFWDKNGQAQLMLQGHKNSVISIDLSPTGGYLATGSGDLQARVWSYTTI